MCKPTLADYCPTGTVSLTSGNEVGCILEGVVGSRAVQMVNQILNWSLAGDNGLRVTHNNDKITMMTGHLGSKFGTSIMKTDVSTLCQWFVCHPHLKKPQQPQKTQKTSKNCPHSHLFFMDRVGATTHTYPLSPYQLWPAAVPGQRIRAWRTWPVCRSSALSPSTPPAHRGHPRDLGTHRSPISQRH